MRVLICAVVIAGAISCKKANIFQKTPFIIGADQIETADSKKADPLFLHSSGLLVVEASKFARKICSGTLIEPEGADKNMRFLTNMHCFLKGQVTDLKDAELIEGQCEKAKVFFGHYEDEAEQAIVLGCKKDSFRSDYRGDLAVFELDKNPPERHKPARIYQGSQYKNRKAVVIHYPGVEADDPHKSKKARFDARAGIQLPYAKITLQDCEMTGKYPERDRSVDQTLSISITNTCDQINGSSGSALWDLETQTILGVNWGGVRLRTPGAGLQTYNTATRADFAAAFINGIEYQEGVSSQEEERSPEIEVASHAKNPPNSAKEKSEEKPKTSSLSTSCGTLGFEGQPFSGMAFFLIPLASLLWPTRQEKVS